MLLLTLLQLTCSVSGDIFVIFTKESIATVAMPRFQSLLWVCVSVHRYHTASCEHWVFLKTRRKKTSVFLVDVWTWTLKGEERLIEKKEPLLFWTLGRGAKISCRVCFTACFIIWRPIATTIVVFEHAIKDQKKRKMSLSPHLCFINSTDWKSHCVLWLFVQ